MHTIRIGTTGWSYKDWVGPLYPTGTTQGDFLAEYARHFDLVEVDSTFYRPPSAQMTQRWADYTPDGFAFALKVPRLITHDRVLVDCDDDMQSFIDSLAPLGSKLKAVLLQFGYFNRQAFSGPRQFFDRLDAFLGRFAGQVPIACEIRNRAWLRPNYFDLLRTHNTAAALVEHAWLPPIDRIVSEMNVVTGPFVYTRLIGDRKGIEEVTKKWDEVVIDRSADIERVAQAVRTTAKLAEVLVLVNNHYAGHAPETCRTLRQTIEGEE